MWDAVRITGENGQVVIEFADNTAMVLRSIFVELGEMLAEDPPPRRLTNERLFANACDRAADSAAFRAAHGARMRAEVREAVGRVLAGWRGDLRLELDRSAVRDWLITLAHAQTRWLKQPRWRAPSPSTFVAKRKADITVFWLQEIATHVGSAALSSAGRAVEYRF